MQLFQHDPDIGYRFVPQLKVRVPTADGGYLVQSNRLGFRSRHDFNNEPAEGSRVLLFGDSFTAGEGVSNGDRYSDVLESMIPSLQVYNFGIPGTGTDQQYITYRKFAAATPCDVVVIAVLVENIRRNMVAYRPQSKGDGSVVFQPKPYFELENGKLVRRFDPVPREALTAEDLGSEASNYTGSDGGRFRELRTLVNALGLKSVVQRLTRYQPTPEYDDAANPAWLLMRAILSEWRSLIRQPVILMPLPLYQHVEASADATTYRQRFRELADEADFILHDPLDDLLAHDAQTRRSFRFGKDIHLTPAGHRAVAQSLSKAIANALDTRPMAQDNL